MKLEIEQVSASDKGIYKLVARNEKGEATSQVVEVTEIMEEGEKPKIASGLKSVVSSFNFQSGFSFKLNCFEVICLLACRRSRKGNPSNLSPVSRNRTAK